MAKSRIVAGSVLGNINLRIGQVPLAAILGIAIVVSIGIPLSFSLNIWQDEAFTMHTTQSGLLYAYLQSLNFEAQPPFYFLIESIWRMANETSIAFARLPSIIFAASAVAVIVMAASRMAKRIHPLAVALISAFNPIVIWSAVEMRVYALVLLIGAVLTWTFFEGFLVFKPSRTAQISYVIFAIIGLYTQYYVGFVLAAHFITLLLLRRKVLVAFICSMAVVSAVFAPFLGVVKMQVANSSDADMNAKHTVVQVVHSVVFNIFSYMLPHSTDISKVWKIAEVLCVLLFLGLVLRFGKVSIKKSTEEPMLQIAAWSATCVIFILIFDVSGMPSNLSRHLIVLAPSSILVTFTFMSAVTRVHKPLYGIAILIFTVFASSQFWHLYRPPLAKIGDWQRVAATVTGGQAIPVAVFPAEMALPLQVYATTTDIISIPTKMPFGFDYASVSKLHSDSEVAYALAPVYKDSLNSKLWIITRLCADLSREGCDLNEEFLENYLNHHYHLVKTIGFNGSLVRLYEKRRFSS